jgi:hypothetical protein
MAHLDLAESRAAGALEALYWWRRDSIDDTAPAEPLAQQLAALAACAAPATPSIDIIDLPGNRMRATAEARRAVFARKAANEAIDPDLLAAIEHERRNAMFAVATGLVATVAPAGAAIYAAATHENLALGFAMAGTFAASFALYHAVRWLLLMRSDELPKIFA